MNKIRSWTSVLVGVLALAALAWGLTWLLGPQGARPAAQRISPLQTPQARPSETPVPTPTFPPDVIVFRAETPTPWLTPTPLPQPTRRPGPTETPLPLRQPAPDAAGEIIYITGARTDLLNEGDLLGNTLSVSDLAVDKAGIAQQAAVQLTSAAIPNVEWGAVYPSPDGRRLAVVGAWGWTQIFDTETGQLEQLAPLEGGGDNCFFGWHPDSRRILYRQGAGPDRGLVLVDTEQYTLLVREDVPQAIRNAAVSPDGKWVLYYFSRGDAGVLRILNVDGGDTRVLSTCGADGRGIAWSPDGSKFGFFGCNGYTIMNANGDVLQVFELSITYPFEPLWSPDGRLLLSVSTTRREKVDPYDPFRQHIVHVVDVATGEELLTLEEATDPTWSPDGSQIAFVSARSGAPELWAVNVDGSNLRQLTHDAQSVRFPFWRRARQP